MDPYETPAYVLDMLLEELNPEEWTIWQPFPNSGYSVRHMRSRGFQVTTGAVDGLFAHKEIPKPCKAGQRVAVVTKPPFSHKKEVLQKLHELNVQHMALLLPLGTVNNAYFHKTFPQNSNQLIIHQLHCRFLHQETHERLNKAPFNILWVTTGLEMRMDIMYKLRVGN